MRIGDLSASQLARHATTTFVLQGRTEMAFRLTYHALALDTKQPDAIMRLSDFLDFPAVQDLSVAVLEYGCSNEIGLSPQERAPIEDLRFRAQWSWGFSRHRSGRTDLYLVDFEDRSQFDLDRERYEAYVAGVVGDAGSLYNAFRAAHTSGRVGRIVETPRSRH